MNINTSVNVVEQIPSWMIGVFVDNEVIPTIPAPIGTYKPIPGRDFEIESSRKPEAVMVAIDLYDVIAVVRAETFKMPVLIGMLHVIACVVGRIVTIPMVVVHVLRSIDFPVLAFLGLRLGVSLPLGWRRRNSRLVRSR